MAGTMQPSPGKQNTMRLANRTFADLHPGGTAEPTRLITPADLHVFAASARNYNPMNLPEGDLDGDGQPQ